MSIGALAAATCSALARESSRFDAANTHPDGAMDPDPGRVDLIARAHALLVSLQGPTLGPFLADWPVGSARRVALPSPLPVLRWLTEAKTDAPPICLELVAQLCRDAPWMTWRQTYKASEVGAAFMENYGYSEIAGLSGPLASERIACGFLLLGPATFYPPHRHEAEEIYIPLAGTASWQNGDGIWRERLPGTVIHHASNEPHAMRTGARALLALYLWRSTNLNQESHFDR